MPEKVRVIHPNGEQDYVYPHNVRVGDRICDQNGLPESHFGGKNPILGAAKAVVPEKVRVIHPSGERDDVYPHNVRLGDRICDQNGLPMRRSRRVS